MSQAHSSAQNRVSGSPNGLWSSPRAHIDGDGSLVIFGHYLGPKASLIGDELESWIKVEAQHLDRLADQLRGRLYPHDGKGTRMSSEGIALFPR